MNYLAGILSDCPGFIRRGSIPGLAFNKDDKATPCARAIAAAVSPDLTTYTFDVEADAYSRP
jgi:hypothetical protein